MTNHEIIADDLALYVLGALPPVEQQRIRAHVETCSECQAEAQRLRADAAMLALTSPPVEPPTRARQRLMNEISREAPVEKPVNRGVRWWWIALPSLLSVALAVLAIVLTFRNQDLQDALKNTERQSARQVTALSEARRVLETMSAPDAMRVTLTTPASRQPMAQAVYQRERGRLVLVASNLAPLAPGHVYQLWLMPPNNAAPVPAGTFEPDERGHASMFMAMPPNMDAGGFAVTIEQTGGSMAPTTKPILVGTTS